MTQCKWKEQVKQCIRYMYIISRIEQCLIDPITNDHNMI